MVLETNAINLFDDSKLYILSSCEIVGKHPNEEEANTYDIRKDTPVFMSVKKDRDLSEEYTVYLKNSNMYFRNDYTL